MGYNNYSVCRVIIIDDELASANYLSKLVSSNFPHLRIENIAHSVKEGLNALCSAPVDLVFLDIDMPDGTGFELLEQFTNREFEVIFTTAFDNYAVKAFKSNAVDYLLKPIDEKELIVSVNRALEKLNLMNKKRGLNNSGIERNAGLIQKKIIEISTLECVEYICVEEVVRCEAMGNYTSIFLQSGKKLVVSKTLADVEVLISSPQFYRVHKSHVVNLQMVRRFVKGEGGSIEIANGVLIPVSRRKRIEFFEVMERLVNGKG